MPRWSWIGPLVVLAMLSTGAEVTAAIYTGTASVDGNGFTTATLYPATNLSATPGCDQRQRPQVTLSWSPTPSTFADGYDVRRSLSDGGPYTTLEHLTGRGTVTTTDAGLSLNATYYYVIAATADSWTSVDTSQVAVTTPANCSGQADPPGGGAPPSPPGGKPK